MLTQCYNRKKKTAFTHEICESANLGVKVLNQSKLKADKPHSTYTQ